MHCWQEFRSSALTRSEPDGGGGRRKPGAPFHCGRRSSCLWCPCPAEGNVRDATRVVAAARRHGVGVGGVVVGVGVGVGGGVLVVVLVVGVGALVVVVGVGVLVRPAAGGRVVLVVGAAVIGVEALPPGRVEAAFIGVGLWEDGPGAVGATVVASAVGEALMPSVGSASPVTTCLSMPLSRLMVAVATTTPPATRTTPTTAPTMDVLTGNRRGARC